MPAIAPFADALADPLTHEASVRYAAKRYLEIRSLKGLAHELGVPYPKFQDLVRKYTDLARALNKAQEDVL